MNISIISVGKLKEKYLKSGIEEYTKRLGSYTKINEIEVADEKAPEQLSDADMEIVKKKEAERILAKIAPDAYVIALAIDGKMKTSEQLAKDIESLMTYGRSKIVFVIGGSLGLHDEVLKRADEKLSFSKMTFPHQLMKLILVEQVYRAFRIMKGEPYHK
ncbi:23S rRNA (pseudouridine(1915)-N(3))-methyltransferase RlmH [Microbacterium sp. APC 3898]|uniref:Ribosomal RNA large subunit methyltransferase H n=2 Tax=Planococcus TaxID=1372 RepID=A0ABT7ZJ38_9BACL|nr:MULTISPECIES: 23S rRNA (pseudouridine(1915)-N(3))-methyltransferase RlmH [Terrabacteria group]MBF6632884.1 23S rRNA (pseudouridine(1915)-N(3))-methyltransferase RlmH [Planococcus sp. (in: firmicutes)]MBD8014313.1 23S rRNA (pseudouridine(1915)-N(3))-methyltransferase RlmH [Planococcus wigleyi]MDN3427164.1 23S rRNA (pseudouridine(1915)-N(3))-methyltransferase RlmH [Planococcus sp. APC 4016]MDN3436484.1 23S rRNA (pseudouridine(1915)-N(3))-methyltransferase RlmH [Planococcus sp. APC 3900]MDN349